MPATLGLKIGIIGYDENGEQIHHQEQEGNSWVGNWFGWVGYFLAQQDVGGHNMVDTGGTTRTASYVSGTCFDTAAGTATGGICVGTGNTAVAIGDYNLAAAIAHGTGAGQLSYGAHTRNNASGSTSPITWTVTRSFTNNSGGNITIAEVGIRFDASYDMLLERTVLSPSYTVNNGASCVVTYTFTFTFA